MSDVHSILVQIKPPKGSFPGQVVLGYYTLIDDVVTLTDKNGRPAGAETGKKFSRKVEPGQDARSIAAKMTKELRIALLPGGKAAINGFDRPIAYPKFKAV